MEDEGGDEDFSFRGEGEMEPGEEERIPKAMKMDLSELQRMPLEEASGKGALEEVASANDPAEFAYSPFDPRYYENTSNAGMYVLAR